MDNIFLVSVEICAHDIVIPKMKVTYKMNRMRRRFLIITPYFYAKFYKWYYIASVILKQWWEEFWSHISGDAITSSQDDSHDIGVLISKETEKNE